MGVFEAALAALRIWLPLASLEIHVEHLKAAEHGDLWLSQLGIWSIHLGHGESLQHGQDGDNRRKKIRVNETEHWQCGQIVCPQDELNFVASESREMVVKRKIIPLKK